MLSLSTYWFCGHFVHFLSVVLYIGVSMGQLIQLVKLPLSKTVPFGHNSQL